MGYPKGPSQGLFKKFFTVHEYSMDIPKTRKLSKGSDFQMFISESRLGQAGHCLSVQPQPGLSRFPAVTGSD